MPARIIDDYDPFKVTKEGKWDLGGDPNQFNETCSFSVTVGDSISVRFNGTYIAVFGVWDTSSVGCVWNYSVDGALPDQVTTPGAAGDIIRQMFWMKKGLAPGPHTLRATLHDIKSGTVWFDAFQVDESNLDVPAEVAWNGRFVQPSPGPEDISLFPVGSIVGIVIATLVFLLWASILILMWWRMRRESSGAQPGETRQRDSTITVGQRSIDPFIMSPVASDDASPSHTVKGNSMERSAFDTTYLVRGPPAQDGRKLGVGTQDHLPSGQHSARARSESVGASSISAGTSPEALPPGAQPPVLFTSSMVNNTEPPQRAGEGGIFGAGIMQGGEERITASMPSPLQHVDSNTRVDIPARISGEKRAQLSPGYN